MTTRQILPRAFLLAAALSVCSLYAQTAPAVSTPRVATPRPVPPKVTTPREAFGFNIGDDYHVATYAQLVSYWKKLATESDRIRLVDIGPTEEGRRQYMAIVSSPANLKRLDRYKEIAQRLARAEGLTEEQARALAREGKAVVWIDGGLHATETVGSQQLIEMVYQMVSRSDEETMRLNNDVIQLYVQANPDGQDLVANWYMRGSEDPKAPLREPAQRSMSSLPRLYAKYIGHDDNRDFYMSAMKETTNMNRQLFLEWFPQLMYNHHQTGPAGTVIFMPPFRDPFNYHFDPLIPLGVEMVGTAMHSRLVAEGKGGSVMRSGASYSTWWNGGLRTVTYFHNMIGILTEIIGNPTPMNIALVPEKQLPQGDWPLPIAPQRWHYRQSIDYEMSNNRAMLDIASRYRETFLFNIWRMGMNSIEKAGKDNWTVTPKRIEALHAAASAPAGGRGGVPSELYNTVLRDPRMRDPRGYIIPADQADFPTATEFINALLKTGITIHRATAAFTIAGKNYPAGSYVVKAAQPFRPHVMDMFEPQDHPHDFRYPGGPPVAPYDTTGWTLAMQMGVRYDRILDAFDGPFAKLPLGVLLPPPPATVTGPANPAGYLISHQVNNSFKLLNRLLKANAEVYWMKGEMQAGGRDLGTGAIWVPASATVRPILDRGARELGVAVHAVAKAPAGEAMKLKPIRIGLYDQYGGSMPSGWTRWIFEQFEMPFERVFAPALDSGDLKSRFDVLVFPDGAIRRGAAGGRGGAGGGGGRGPSTDGIPAEYRAQVGRISDERTMPALRKFVESGGSVVTIGSSTSIAEVFGIPVKNHLVEKAPDGREVPLSRDKFYVPGSLLRANIDNTHPLAFGMPKQVEVFYDSSPVFRIDASGAIRPNRVAWFSGKDVLSSGWAWGPQYLDDGTAVAEASVGEGKVVLLGPEVAFRSQPHGTFKLLFNGLYYGSAKTATLP